MLSPAQQQLLRALLSELLRPNRSAKDIDQPFLRSPWMPLPVPCMDSRQMHPRPWVGPRPIRCSMRTARTTAFGHRSSWLRTSPGRRSVETEVQSPRDPVSEEDSHRCHTGTADLAGSLTGRRQPVPFRSRISAGAEAVVARPSTFRSHPPVLASLGLSRTRSAGLAGDEICRFSHFFDVYRDRHLTLTVHRWPSPRSKARSIAGIHWHGGARDLRPRRRVLADGL